MPDPQAPRLAQVDHKDRFVYDAEADPSPGPQGHRLTVHGRVARGTGTPPDRKERASTPAGPVRARCTTSTTKGRSIAISPHDAQLRAHRARLATEAARTA